MNLEQLQANWIPRFEKEIEELQQNRRDIESFNETATVPMDTGFETLVISYRQRMLRCVRAGELEKLKQLNGELERYADDYLARMEVPE